MGLPEPTLDSGLNDLCSRIDRILEDFLAEQKGVLEKFGPQAAEPAGHIETMIRGGGKRIRPVFCYWGYRAAGGEETEPILRAAASLELLHTMALVHDDIIDQAPVRRGRPALHREAAQIRRGEGRGEQESEHFGISAALLTGDLAFAMSNHLLAASGFPPEVLAAAEPYLHEMKTRAAAGQYLDLVSSGAGRGVDPERARWIARLKTASYTVEGPLLIGAALAGAGERLREALSAYGSALGEAYQLQNDLLGLFGDRRTNDHAGESDLRQGKATLVIAEALRLAGPQDRALIESIWGHQSADSGQIDSVRQTVHRSGAVEVVRSSILDLVSGAKGALADLTHPTLHREASIVLNGLADRLIEPSNNLGGS